MKVKICGLKTREDVQVADAAGADFLGFVFYAPSVRNVSPQIAGEISHGVRAKKVAVVVDASDDLLAEIVENLQPDFIQLHGKESDARAVEVAAKFGLPLIRACGVNDYPESNLYEYVLIDSPGGGTGEQFDYSNFQAPTQNWFLSGGLNAQNVTAAVKATSAKMVDISSGVEREKGVKDIRLIKDFLKITHELTS